MSSCGGSILMLFPTFLTTDSAGKYDLNYSFKSPQVSVLDLFNYSYAALNVQRKTPWWGLILLSLSCIP